MKIVKETSQEFVIKENTGLKNPIVTFLFLPIVIALLFPFISDFLDKAIISCTAEQLIKVNCQLNVDFLTGFSGFLFINLFIIFWLLGIVFYFIVIDTGYIIIIFDKLTNQIYYKKVNLLGKKRNTYDFREITSVIIEEYTDGDGDKKYRLILPIANQKYTLDLSYNSNQILETATKISDFLQVPVENIVK